MSDDKTPTAARSKSTPAPPCRLEMIDGRLHAHFPDRDAAVAARVVYLRPLTGRSEVTLLDDDGAELLTLPGIDSLAPSCQELAREALAERYHLPHITAVTKLEILFGTQYWDVDTDRGARRFALREPGRNLLWLSPDHLIVRDTMGNRFEIPSLAALDARSRAALGRVL